SVLRAWASRRIRSATSEYVHEHSPAIRATPWGAVLARRSIHGPMPAFRTVVLTGIPPATCAAVIVRSSRGPDGQTGGWNRPDPPHTPPPPLPPTPPRPCHPLP